MLESLSGLQNLTSILGIVAGGVLKIQYNDVLADCCDIEDLLNGGTLGSITISNNATDCDSQPAVEAACGDPCAGSKILSTQAEVDAYTCTTHDGDLTINGSGNAGDPITNLDALSGLFKVTGKLVITSTDLTSLDGLGGLTFVDGRLDIYNNPLLQSINGINVLFEVGDDLLIEDNDALTQINGFSALSDVQGEMLIGGNTPLTTLSDFPALSHAGAIKIQFADNLLALPGFPLLAQVDGDALFGYNDAVQTVSSFPSLTQVGGELRISSCEALGSISGFPLLQSVGELEIRDNDAMTVVDGFPVLTTINGEFQISEHLVLTSISGFPALTTVDGHLKFDNDDALTTISGFNALTSLNGDLEIKKHEVLASITGFNALPSAKSFSIEYCPTLTTIDGFNSLHTVLQNIYISSNASLTDITGFQNLTNVGNLNTEYGKLNLYSNSSLSDCCCFFDFLENGTYNPSNIQNNVTDCNTEAEIITACADPCAGSKTLSTQAEVDAYDCTIHDGDLTINGSGNGGDPITNLDALSGLEEVTGNLTIASTDLTSLDGLGNLTTVGGTLQVNNNSTLQSINGFNSLSSVEGNMNIQQNIALVELNGFQSLSAINNGNLTIADNPSDFVSFNGFQSLLQVGPATGMNDLTIEDNGSFPSLSNFSSLLLAGKITVSDNGDIGGTLDFPNLQLCYELEIRRNESIASLGSFSNLAYVAPWSSTWDGDVTLNGEILSDISGFTALQTVAGDLTIGGGTGVSGFPVLTSVGGLVIEESDLQSITGFASLNTVSSSIDIYGNEFLQTINSFNALTSFGELYVSDNDALTSIQGFQAIVDAGEINISGNNQLTDINGFGMLETVEASFGIVENSALSNIVGFQSLTSVIEHFRLYVNENLSSCCVFYNLLNNGEVGKNTEIYGNATGCKSEPQILNSINAVCHASIDVYLDADGEAALTPADLDNGSTSDCGIDHLSIDDELMTCADGEATLNGNPPTVTLTVTDVNGAFATCETTVNVLDNVGPELTCPSSHLVSLDHKGNAFIEFTDLIDPNDLTDNCFNPGSHLIDLSQSAFDCSEAGTTVPVTLTVTDGYSGLTDACTIDVNVVDNTRPEMACNFQMTLTFDENGEAFVDQSLALASLSDNCTDSADIQVSFSQPMFTCDDLGQQLATTVSAVDEQGNEAFNCVVFISLHDQMAPVVNGGQPYTFDFDVYLNANGEGVLDGSAMPQVITDNCSAFADLTFEFDGGQSSLMFDCGSVGAGPLVYDLSIIDEKGNTNTDHQVSVTVLDTVKPEALCQNISVFLGLNGEAQVSVNDVDNGSNDNCGTVELLIEGTQGAQTITYDCDDVPNVNMSLEVKDPSGNSSTCTAVVTVSPQVTVTQLNVTDETCDGASDGAIEIVATGNSQLQYSIDGGINWNLTGTFIDLGPGSYDVIVKNQEGISCGNNVATVASGPSPTDWYKDMDGDGYSDGIIQTSCGQPVGYYDSSSLTATSGDCNDNDASEHPGQTWYEDIDGDGYSNGNWSYACQRPTSCFIASELIATDGDCDDSIPTCYPGATEVCNGVDDDCDGEIDEGTTGGLTYTGNLFFTTQAQVDDFSPCYSIIDGNVTITGGGINSLASLTNLEEINGNLTIQSTGLANMVGLENLTDISGTLTIFFNTSLGTLDGFGNLASVGGNLMLYYNFALPDCCAFHGLLDNSGVGGNTTIFFNQPGCNSQADIINSCNSGNNLIGNATNSPAFSNSIELLEVEKTTLKVFPNPNEGAFTIDINSLDGGELQLYDTAHRLLWSKATAKSGQQLNVSLTEVIGQGIYFLVFKTAKETVTAKLVVK